MNINNIGRRRTQIFSKSEPAFVSLFFNYDTPKPIGTVDINKWLLSIKYKEKVEEVCGAADPKEKRKLKSKLPAITPSGIFSYRSNKHLVKHSGFLCIDIDGKENPHIKDWDQLKESLSDMDGLFYAGLSASGKGIFLLFRINYPEKHEEHFYSLANDFRQIDITVDSSCRDICRLRGASFDSSPIYNPDCGVYSGLLSVPTTLNKKLDLPDGITDYRVLSLVKQIEQQRINICEYYPDWYAIGQSIASEFGQSGRILFHSISSQSHKYDSSECDREYDKCLRNCSRKSISTFFWYCKQYGLTCKKQTV